MVKFISIIVIILCTKDVRGQNYFDSVPYTGGQNNQSRLFDTYPDSNLIYVLGDLMDTTIDISNPTLRPWWGAFNYQGELVKKKILFSELIPGTIEVTGCKLLKKSDKELYYYTKYFDSSLTAQGILLNIDLTNGTIKNSKVLRNPVDSLAYLLPRWYTVEKNSSGNIILGSTIEVDNSAIPFIVTVDSNFNIVYEVIVEDNGRDNLMYYIEADSDTTFVMIGESWKRDDVSSSPSIRPYFMKVNSKGKILEFNYASEIVDKTVQFSLLDTYTIIKDVYGNWIFSAISYFPFGWHTIPYVYSFNNDLTHLNWKKSFTEDINDTKQKNLIYYCDYDPAYDTYLVGGIDINKSQKSSYIFKISGNGDSLWTRHYAPVSWDKDSVIWPIITDVKHTLNNSYVGVGYASKRPESLWRSWIIGMDAFGCTTQKCQIMVGTKELMNNKTSQFAIYPNPASSFLSLLCKNENISHVRVSLLDLNSRYLDTSDFYPQVDYIYTFDLSKFTSGTYILKITDIKGTLIQNEKIIIK